MLSGNFLPRSILSCSILCLFAGCGNKDNQPVSLISAASMRDSIVSMTRSLSGDLSAKGPMAWLYYFDHSPQFFMAADGQQVFPDFQTADHFVREFSKTIRKVDLTLASVRIDSLSAQEASLGADYRETLTDSAGRASENSGYLTGLLDQTKSGWQFRNLHWSVKH
jgi:hypothetical protein